MILATFCLFGRTLYAVSPIVASDFAKPPTAEETLFLEMVNRFRANPFKVAKRMKPPRFGKVDMEMFVSECKALKPSPPLVFALELQESARNHSHYMNLNGQTHYEDSTKRGYT